MSIDSNFSTASEIVEGQGKLITVNKEDNVSQVVDLLKKKAISQLPVVDGNEFVVSRALQCLSQLLDMALLSRSILLGLPATGSSEASHG